MKNNSQKQWKKVKYVVGFLRETNKILLIRKKKPEWQAGKLNGIGGHIEAKEKPIAAMRREFEEETGLAIRDWTKSVTMRGRDWTVHVFFAYGPIHKARSITDEEVLVAYIDRLPGNVLPNLHWLIPLSFDKQVTKPIEIRYSNSEDLATAKNQKGV